MKALSIRQPYAWAIVNGFKDVENRPWRTRYRGPFLVHAGKIEEVDDIAGVLQQIAAATGYANLEQDYWEERQLGGIVGIATLTDCVDRHASPWFHGPRGFVLTDARPLPFRALAGKQGFFAAGEP